jgi:hypothetical protein
MRSKAIGRRDQLARTWLRVGIGFSGIAQRKMPSRFPPLEDTVVATVPDESAAFNSTMGWMI